MGVSSAGPSSAESRGWTSERALAFEEHLRAHKFNIFAISRMGTGRKKPSDPPRAADRHVGGRRRGGGDERRGRRGD